MNLHHKNVKVARLSVISNTVLMFLKLAVGLMIGSVSIISEAIHSGVDLLAALIALFSVRTSNKPADAQHPFGHGKVENISGTIEAILILFAATWIVVEAIGKLIDMKPLEYVGWGVTVMLFSTVVNTLVSKKLFDTAKETGSIALEADAWHLRTDVYTSAGVMISLAIIWMGRWISPEMNLVWLDPVAAIIVALFILRLAYTLTIKSGRDLMDEKLPAEEELMIRNIISSHQPEVHGYHRLRTRKSGIYRFIDFHIKVDPHMSVEDSHRITDELSSTIGQNLSKASVTVHTEPCDGKCDSTCLAGCLLSREDRDNIKKEERSDD